MPAYDPLQARDGLRVAGVRGAVQGGGRVAPHRRLSRPRSRSLHATHRPLLLPCNRRCVPPRARCATTSRC
eukprot:5451219-Prymnesium_polylepis.1